MAVSYEGDGSNHFLSAKSAYVEHRPIRGGEAPRATFRALNFVEHLEQEKVAG